MPDLNQAAVAEMTSNLVAAYVAKNHLQPSELPNALLNLCINARDAMPDGGRITIETANRQVDLRQAAERDMPDGQYLVLSVSDDGSGMPPEVIARAFEPFFTTKPIGQGTGLGLSMIYGFARQSGGQVRIHSVLGEGTSISIYLPRHVGTAEVGKAVPQGTLIPVAEAGETVLVVDDEPTVRMFSNQILRYLRKPEGLVYEQGLPAHRAGPDAYVTAHHLRDIKRAGRCRPKPGIAT